MALLIVLSPFVGAAETILLDTYSGEIVLGQTQIQYLEDAEDTLTIEHLRGNHKTRFSPSTQDVLNFGHTDSSIWVHFAFTDRQTLEQYQTWILHSSFPLLARFDLYVFQDNELKHTYNLGYTKDMVQRILPHRFFAQPLRINSNSHYDIYVNVKRSGGTVQVPLTLSKPTHFIYKEMTSNYVFGIFFGIMIAMAIYNLFLFFSVGSLAYFYYLIYIVASLFTYLSITGYGYLYLWGQAPAVNEYITQITTTITVISGILFFRNFVEINKYFPAANHYLNVMLSIGVGLLLVKAFTDYFLSLHISIYLAVITALAPFLTYKCWRNGSRPAGYFLIAWIALIIGVLLFVMNLLGFLPTNSFTNNAILIGCAAEMLLLSLGLADRINMERKERYAALEQQHKAVIRLKEAEDRLMHRALHTRTTGLPNRTFLRSTLDSLLLEKREPAFYLCLINLNNFHEFNKTLGHSNGDAILYLVTERIKKLCKSLDGILPIEQLETGNQWVANVEGVTFALIIKQHSTSNIQQQCNQLITGIERPFSYQGLTLNVDVTAGVALYPQHGETSENLLRNAQIALEAASGNNDNYSLYSGEIDPYNARRITLLSELRNAIENDALQLYFQPQISLETQQVAGVEVLIRWIHPEFGFIPPDEFIPIAERTGVIHPLTLWICRNAFKFKKQLQDQGYNINLSINISARNLQDPGFCQQINKIAKECNTTLNNVIMEITETAIMKDPDFALKVMSDLNKLGIRLSIDDFGTGYSSLSYLKKLPVNEIKIDRSFVMEMANNNDDQVIVHTTLTMGHNLSLDVVAEGIEDAGTMEKLRQMGCDLAQGYHIARPMPGADFLIWLNQNHYNQNGNIANKA